MHPLRVSRRFCHDDEILGYGCSASRINGGDVRAVVVAGVDVVHTGRTAFRKTATGRLPIAGRPRISRGRTPHRAVAKPPDEPVAEAGIRRKVRR